MYIYIYIYAYTFCTFQVMTACYLSNHVHEHTHILTHILTYIQKGKMPALKCTRIWGVGSSRLGDM